MRLSGTHLYKRVCLSVSPLARLSVKPVQKPCFSAVFGHDEILSWKGWNKWSKNVFWELPLLPCCFIGLFVHLSLHICHMINTSKATARTHRCPVGLVLSLSCICSFSDGFAIWLAASAKYLNGLQHHRSCPPMTTVPSSLWFEDLIFSYRSLCDFVLDSNQNNCEFNRRMKS